MRARAGRLVRPQDVHLRARSGKPDPDYKFHVEHYGHPSKFGFKDIDQPLEGRKWEPEKLIAPLQEGGREVLRRPGQPSRQLRLLRLEVPAVELA